MIKSVEKGKLVITGDENKVERKKKKKEERKREKKVHLNLITSHFSRKPRRFLEPLVVTSPFF